MCNHVICTRWGSSKKKLVSEKKVVTNVIRYDLVICNTDDARFASPS
jgi:hypothetical protein